MGRRGPPPKPTKLKIAAGNPGKRPLNPHEPQPVTSAPRMPAWLSKRAKAEWRRIVPELTNLGLLTRIDLAALAAYCQAYAELEEATRTLDKEGRVCVWPVLATQDVFEEVANETTGKTETRLKVAKGQKIGEKLKSHPAVQQQRDAARLVKQFISEFGLTPASRTRVHGGTGEEKDGSDRTRLASKFFGRGG
jgi:P27 family predicted phage terminase small subunit